MSFLAWLLFLTPPKHSSAFFFASMIIGQPPCCRFRPSQLSDAWKFYSLSLISRCGGSSTQCTRSSLPPPTYWI
ncbi:hypothetical protein C8R47DRAFT_1158992 [Mycena vitilis]|nr:hypothetical protein C8R47DRAFT_1158992 [Mycena vitilis]